ncbi:M14 family metallopeptidase [Kaistia nematophila]|uniref:M14 family metallopeptidase n=1 Tax=Kaistia nematophila TaxID=2994654 RepID=A0A9X3ILP2_9HYPH|nr:M14 family metallopeptidase [Kaistia nematophila]
MIAGVTLDDTACFSSDYQSAREKLRSLALPLVTRHETYANPNLGPSGEALATDAYWFGPADARNVLVLVSATHGVEGFCGSGAQVDWLVTDGLGLLPPATAALVVHALNPHGFAWLRRTTEEGVDLNRNCLDFAAGLPANPGYDELASAFVPASIDAATLAEADARIEAYRAKHGQVAFETARSSGQYSHPEGIFYGGTETTWSIRTLGRIVADFDLASRDHVAVIDYHTGLGPHGYGEPICGHRPGESGQARCRAWYGESLGEPMLGKSASLPIAGLTQYAWGREVGADRLTFVALEFGTFPPDEGAAALRADHWLHAHGSVDWPGEETRRIKAALRRFYHPDTPDWRQMVLLRSRQVIAQALAGMAATPPDRSLPQPTIGHTP